MLGHPGLELVALGSDLLAGERASALDPRLGRNGHGGLPSFVTNADALDAGAELVFCCLDHEAAVALEPPDGAVVLDLSGAHRLADPAAYAEWYGFFHPGGNEAWCYALPEHRPRPPRRGRSRSVAARDRRRRGARRRGVPFRDAHEQVAGAVREGTFDPDSTAAESVAARLGDVCAAVAEARARFAQ